MTHLERLSPVIACTSCGAALSRDRLVSLELDIVHQELARTLSLLGSLKPMLITAAYYLDQHAHLLHDTPASGADDAALLEVRQAQARQISGELMDAYCRSIELLALARR